MNLWLFLLPLNLIYSECIRLRCNPNIIAAIVSTESNGNPYAVRYEERYSYVLSEEEIESHAKYNSVTNITELVNQKHSVGLMQIMFANMRAQGFKGSFAESFGQKENLHHGIIFFNNLFDRYDNSFEDAVSAYNQGSPRKNKNGKYSNQKYVDKVMKKYRFLDSLKPYWKSQES